MIFRSSVRLCRRTFAHVETKNSPFDAMETGFLARDVGRVLGCDPEMARSIANAVAWRMTLLERLARSNPRNGARSIANAIPSPVDLDPLMRLESRDHPYILALPYTTDAIVLLAHLALSTRRTVLIEQTPLTQALKPLFPCEFATPDEITRRNRMRNESTARSIFVTFPDHHLTLEGTTRPVTIFGKEFQFSLAEALLFVRGASPIVTLHQHEGRFLLETYDAPVDRQAVREQDALAIVEWLAARIESVVRAAPMSVLSWQTIAQRTSTAATLRRVMEGRMLQALVRLGTLNESTRQWALDRLRTIEAGYKEGEAA